MVSSGAGNESITNVILQFLQDEQWGFQQVNQQPVFRTGYHGERGTWVCYLRADEERRQFLFHVLMGLNIPPPSRAAVAEFLTRVNYTLVTGNFEMNMDTGGVRYRAGLDVPDGEMRIELLRALIYASLHNMDLYFPGFLAVVHAGLSPEAALARLESNAILS